MIDYEEELLEFNTDDFDDDEDFDDGVEM